MAMMTLREGWCASHWEEAGARRRAPGLCSSQQGPSHPVLLRGGRGMLSAGFHSCIFRSVCCRIGSERQGLPDRGSQPFPKALTADPYFLAERRGLSGTAPAPGGLLPPVCP